MRFMAYSKLEMAEIYANEKDCRSINCAHAGNKWSDFVKGVLLSVENRAKSTYPLAKLNKDQSVSFILEEAEDSSQIDSPEQQFSKDLHEPYIIEQLNFCCEKLGLAKVNSNESFLIKKQHPYHIVEYQFNISPQVFDSLLKLQSDYSYRGENNLLKLYKKFTLTPGKIALFPVSPLSDEENLVRAAGCQLVELFTIQLLHLLPDYDGEEKYFHWVPEKVAEDLQLDSTNVMSLLNTVFENNQMLKAREVALIKMNSNPLQTPFSELMEQLKNNNALMLCDKALFYANQRPWKLSKIIINEANKEDCSRLMASFTDNEKYADEEELKRIASIAGIPIPLKTINAQSSEGLDLILTPSPNATIKMVDIAPNVEALYLLYGNCGAEELKHCKSIEINTREIFQCLQENLISRRTYAIEERNKTEYPNLSKLYETTIIKIERSIDILQKMMAIEENRIALAQENLQAPKGALSIFAPNTTQVDKVDLKNIDIQSIQPAVAP
jgi:hypothetical protein